MRYGRLWLLVCGLVVSAPTARAQFLASYFPEGVPGYDDASGVTVRSRVRPDYQPLGIRAGTVLIKPVWSQSFGYDDNLFAGPERRGAWEIVSAPSVLVGTTSSAGSVGAFVSADDVRYLGAPGQDRTDGAAFLGGAINLGSDKLTLGGGYLARHEDRTALDALPSDRPVAYQVANARASYAASFGRFVLTPAVELNQWHFDNTTILGLPVSQSSRDRTTLQGEIALRQAWMPGRDLLMVTRVLNTRYDEPAAGLPSNNSVRWQALIGADYDENTVWRFRILGGGEYSQAVQSRSTGIMEAEAVWSPSGLTTLRVNATRGIQDAAQAGLSTFTFTSGTLTLDHELMRDLLLNATATVRQADFAGTAGRQVGTAAGIGASWLMDRDLTLSLTYGFTSLHESHLPTSTVTGSYRRDLTLLTLRIGW